MSIVKAALFLTCLFSMGVLPSASEEPSYTPSIFEETKSLTTFFANAGNNFNGNMFNLEAKNNFVSVQQLELNFVSTDSQTVQVYIKDDTYIGFELDSSAWTLVHEETLASTNGAGQGTPLSPFNQAVFIAPGETVAFYVTVSSGGNIWYTNGSQEGRLFSEDQNLKFYEGKGIEYPFTRFWTPRVWNGIIHYTATRPTLMPTEQPSLLPSSQPTLMPSAQPTSTPTCAKKGMMKTRSPGKNKFPGKHGNGFCPPGLGNRKRELLRGVRREGDTVIKKVGNEYYMDD